MEKELNLGDGFVDNLGLRGLDVNNYLTTEEDWILKPYLPVIHLVNGL